jgi:hypothetical protein
MKTVVKDSNSLGMNRSCSRTSLVENKKCPDGLECLDMTQWLSLLGQKGLVMHNLPLHKPQTHPSPKWIFVLLFHAKF